MPSFKTTASFSTVINWFIIQYLQYQIPRFLHIFQEMNVKMFYVLLYFTALKTLLLSPFDYTHKYFIPP